jgi:N-acyl-D-aspartate/D-glutamate deacylase
VETDLLLQGGTIVDGSGEPAFVGDVRIAAGKIAEVGHGLSSAGAQCIDVSDLVVAPGFIDVHTHYDAQVFWDPLLAPSSQYGVTTLVMGNCGIGVAPTAPGDDRYLAQLLASVEGMPEEVLLSALPWSWRSYGDYLREVDRALGPNVIALVGHSPLRYAVMGAAAYERRATPEELVQMQAMLAEALSSGAWGFSSSAAATHNDLAGRPAPSRLAERAEYEALADVLGRYPFGIIGMSPESKLRGLNEQDRSLLTMLSVRGGASVNWNPLLHASSLPDLWRVNLAASEEAATAGARVFGVFNPSSTGGNRVDLATCFLFAALPQWKSVAKLPLGEKKRAFSDPEIRRGLADDLENDTSMGFLSAKLRTMWNILRITQVFSPGNASLVGRTVAEVAKESGETPLDTMLDIAIADDLRTVFMQEDIRREDPAAREAFDALSASPWVLFGGSDAGAHLDMLANESLPARTIEWRVVDQGALKIEEVVRQFTSAIADAIGLRTRGRLNPGLAGDVVVFDTQRIGAGDAHVAYDLPGGGGRLVTEAKGVRYTVVNGTVVFADGRPTGDLGGQLLRSGEHHA